MTDHALLDFDFEVLYSGHCHVHKIASLLSSESTKICTQSRPTRPSKTTRKLLIQLLIVCLVVCLLLQTTVATDDGVCEGGKTEQGECKNPLSDDGNRIDRTDGKESDNASTSTSTPAIRMISKEELAKHIGTGEGDESAIWLSVLGEVYDVTTGAGYYAQGSSYGAFSGTDCSVCFVSGVFTKEEGDKETSEIPSEQIPALMDWRNFYAGHETYKFVGYLHDDRFYNEHGKPTPKMLEFRERVIVAMEEAAVRKAEREKKREELKRKRAEEKKNKENLAAAAKR